ncbi:thiopurine S-methyltransferase [Leptospira sp. 96542]|nr:thiopurine S-methyltransferase [Leptospira sp. 96542]
MDHDFWHQRWEKNEIAFHEKKANPLLVEYFDKLQLKEGSRVFLPLCGKTLDIHWLLSLGFRVAGVELSEIAIKQLFSELGMEPNISKIGSLKHYQAEGIDIFVGDFFQLDFQILGFVDAVYDRAALVALPQNLRVQYTKHLREITNSAKQLLVCFEYEQSQMDGPPFSILENEVNDHYGKHYQMKILDCKKLEGGLKGKLKADEKVWLLLP